MKYIICDAAPANWGKSTTLLEVIKLFRMNPTNFVVLDERNVGFDYWIVFQNIVNLKVYLIQTQGDYAKSFDETKKYLASGKKVDVIICAARSKGKSLKEVQTIETLYNYKQIQFSNFCPLDRSLFSNPFISDVNKVHLAQLIFNFALAL